VLEVPPLSPRYLLVLKHWRRREEWEIRCILIGKLTLRLGPAIVQAVDESHPPRRRFLRTGFRHRRSEHHGGRSCAAKSADMDVNCSVGVAQLLRFGFSPERRGAFHVDVILLAGVCHGGRMGLRYWNRSVKRVSKGPRARGEKLLYYSI